VTVEDATARCTVDIDGAVFPTEFPTAMLQQRGVLEKGRFEWLVRGDGQLFAEDIRPLCEPGLSPEEEAEFRQLREEDASLRGSDIWTRFAK
jgi:hypothetical protein